MTGYIEGIKGASGNYAIISRCHRRLAAKGASAKGNMRFSIYIESHGEEFEYTCESTGKGIKIMIDGEEVDVNLFEIHELGLLLKRQASFCKSRAKSNIFDKFEENWFLGNSKKTDD